MRPSSAHFSETNHAQAEVSFDAVMNLHGVVSLREATTLEDTILKVDHQA